MVYLAVLKYSHPIIVTILCKLFNLFLTNGHVPESFAKSYRLQFLFLKAICVIELSLLTIFWGYHHSNKPRDI